MAKYVLLTLILGGCFWVTPAEREARWDLDGDGIDRPLDCDDQDKEVGGVTWYADVDGDGFGDASITSQECEAPDGYVADGTDCDDGSDAVFPEAEEVCNGADDNCNGVVDDGADVPTWYRDADEDGFGDPSDPVTACEQIEGTVGNADDCDDADAAIRPDADELCNGVDDDCDGDIDLDDLDRCQVRVARELLSPVDRSVDQVFVDRISRGETGFFVLFFFFYNL